MPDQKPSGSASSSANGHERRRRSGRPRRRSGEKPATYAALDLGTNNCRLLIAKELNHGFQIVDSYSKVVRLGQGLAASGQLSQQSMDAAVNALTVCARKMKSKNVKRWRCIATEACRRAGNGEEFLSRVKSETGISLEIISARVEARLAVMGCLNLVDPTKDVALVVDIGGG